jgi:DNA-binding LytR/AlgR family response regulator
MLRRTKHKRKNTKVSRISDTIVFTDKKHTFRKPVEQLEYCEANSHGTLFHFEGNESILSTKNLGYWQKKLPRFFWRIHDKWIVNSHDIDDLVFSERYLKVHNKVLQIARRRLKEIVRKFKASGIY